MDDDNKDDDLYGILNERNIKEVQFGIDKRFPTWYGSNAYFSPDTNRLGYEEDFHTPVKNDVKTQYWLDTLYICEYCFKYTDVEADFVSHIPHCKYQFHAPGRIKYKSPSYTIRRVKGSRHRLFCQCLCLFTKLFLDNKSMYFKVDHYEFYVVYRTGEFKPMAFFSKDLVSYHQNNLACILTFPPYQRLRLGTLLLEFSYKLSTFDNLISGPELPLSPFGLISYLKYWSKVICWELVEGELANCEKLTIETIAKVTGIRIPDIILTMEYLKCLGNTHEIHLSVLRRRLKEFEHKSKELFLLKEEYLLLED